MADNKANIGLVKSFDMNWFSNVPSDIPLSEVEKYARNYWEQKQTDNPVTEVLFQGTLGNKTNQ